jgi:hypothetical protein
MAAGALSSSWTMASAPLSTTGAPSTALANAFAAMATTVPLGNVLDGKNCISKSAHHAQSDRERLRRRHDESDSALASDDGDGRAERDQVRGPRFGRRACGGWCERRKYH